MNGAGTPRGVCFDYGKTLVQFARPENAIGAVGTRLAEELSLGLGPGSGTAAEFALSLDQLVDELIRAGQRADPGREVDFQAIHRQAMYQLLGAWPSLEISDRVAAAIQRAWVDGVVVVPEARLSLIAVREMGLRTGLCSNAPFPPDLMYEQLERLELRQYFDAVLFSSEIGWRKPDPQIFAELLARLGLPAASVWFVGDEWEADIQGARSAGMRAFLAPAVAAPPGEMEQLSRWADLPVRLEQAVIA
ncbi:MAG: HAD-IA family hydrolase [Candidatus Dormiibacterota bacterium]